MVAIFEITRAGKKVGTVRAEHIEGADRARYELAQMMSVHGPSVLRGTYTEYSDGCRSVAPRDTRGKRLGRPYMFRPYEFTPGAV